MKKTILLIICLAAASPCLARPAIAVIAAKSSQVPALTEAQVRSYFLGDAEFLPGGQPIDAVDQAKGAKIVEEFYESLAQMSPKELSIYWAKRIFAGRGTPPPHVDGDDKVKDWVKKTANSIGYVYASSVDSSVKTVLVLPP